MSESEFFLQLTGHSRRHLQTWCGDCLVHRDVIEPLRALCERGAKAGLEVKVASGFRSYQRQLAIWNAKARGERPVLNDAGQLMDIKQLDDEQKVFAILRWSALPGTSRHHWGSELDLWDAAAVPTDYELQLVGEEYERGGPFYPLSAWLQQEIEATPALFNRPYFKLSVKPSPGNRKERNRGVAPEPWHLSFRPVARSYEALLESSVLKAFIARCELELKDVVLAQWDAIYSDFIKPDV